MPMHKDMQYLFRLQTILKNFEKIAQKGGKSMSCVYYNDNSCNFSEHHKTKGVFISTYVAHALLRMEKSVLTVLRIAKVNIQKMINSGHGQ